MTVTIGRASLADIFDVRLSGRRLTFTTDIEAASADEMKAIRQQLAGLVDNRDEEVIPFAWSDDPTLDGFYRVASVNIPSTEVTLTSGFIPDVEVELEQVPGYANPWFEVMVQAVARTNGHGVTAADGQIAFPYDTTDTYSYEWGVLPPSGTATVADGSVRDATVNAPLSLTSVRYATTPAGFYVGSCRIEVKYGSTWYPVVGRQIPRNTLWRISNGRTRLTCANGATSGTLEVWDTVALAWQSANVKHQQTLGPSGIGLGDGTKQPAVTILRNSPEQVVVQVTGPLTSGGTNHLKVAYSLGRGAPHIAVAWTCSTSIEFGPSATAVTPSTSTARGLYQTTADANGNRLWFSAAQSFTASTANGFLYNTASATAGQHEFYLHPINSVPGDALTDVFLCAISQTQRVVNR